jgi:hypothetical protein
MATVPTNSMEQALGLGFGLIYRLVLTAWLHSPPFTVREKGVVMHVGRIDHWVCGDPCGEPDWSSGGCSAASFVGVAMWREA